MSSATPPRTPDQASGDQDVSDSPRPWVADHIRRYLATGGADGHEWQPGVPTLLLTTTGRRSGKRRRTALIYGRAADAYVVVASQGGAPTHPAWYLNLDANPEVEIQVRDERLPARARTASSEEKARLWPMMAAIFPPYDEYQAKTDRDIPVVVLDPR